MVEWKSVLKENAANQTAVTDQRKCNLKIAVSYWKRLNADPSLSYAYIGFTYINFYAI